ncbi:MAG: glycosyltransferase family 2 protein [Acidobacteria bacterium]|nr:MAG: glycosyltransferase family 2 protein [Acidobacteriota bacterium]REK05640.1 MAG: glycosyltransferase family 2 protein [Acidobacteriota bacterium]
MSTPSVSVVVPSHNRRDVLLEVLEAVCAQQGAPPYELVVVDDGSTDGSDEAARGFARQRQRARGCAGEPGGPLDVLVLSQPNRGPAAARNRGVEAARGRLVAFLGDDTVPSKGWLAAHLAARARPAAERAEAAGQVVGTIGYTGWHRRMRDDRFLRYINEHGLQFGYALIDDADQVAFNFFYTSNLVLPRSALLEFPFDLRFPYPAWEDIELAYRLRQGPGLRLLYVPEATVEHDHPTTIARFCRRQEKAGYCATVFHRLHPELAGFLGLGDGGPPALPWRPRQAVLEVLARGLQKFGYGWPTLWEEVLRYHYVRGLHRGWRDRESPLAEAARGESAPVADFAGDAAPQEGERHEA